MPAIVAFLADALISIGVSEAIATIVAVVVIQFALGSFSFEADGITYELIGRDE